MRIYAKNIPAKFHPDPTWNDGALGFFEEVSRKEKKDKNKISSDVRSAVAREQVCGLDVWLALKHLPCLPNG